MKYIKYLSLIPIIFVMSMVGISEITSLLSQKNDTSVLVGISSISVVIYLLTIIFLKIKNKTK